MPSHSRISSACGIRPTGIDRSHGGRISFKNVQRGSWLRPVGGDGRHRQRCSWVSHDFLMTGSNTTLGACWGLNYMPSPTCAKSHACSPKVCSDVGAFEARGMLHNARVFTGGFHSSSRVVYIQPRTRRGKPHQGQDQIELRWHGQETRMYVLYLEEGRQWH